MKITVKIVQKPESSFEKNHPVELTVGKTQRLNLTLEEAQDLRRQLALMLPMGPLV